MAVGIVDYGSGNLASIANALDNINAQHQFVSDPAHLANYDHIILPGVGNFHDCAAKLLNNGWYEAIISAFNNGKFLLGICVGMQLLFKRSDEGNFPGGQQVSGLSLLDADVSRLITPNNERLPHVGWNSIVFDGSGGSPIFQDIQTGADMYFTHSYGVYMVGKQHALAHAQYGKPFTAVVRVGSFYGVQFHPEKSGRPGFQLLKNFVNL